MRNKTLFLKGPKVWGSVVLMVQPIIWINLTNTTSREISKLGRKHRKYSNYKSSKPGKNKLYCLGMHTQMVKVDIKTWIQMIIIKVSIMVTSRKEVGGYDWGKKQKGFLGHCQCSVSSSDLLTCLLCNYLWTLYIFYVL